MAKEDVKAELTKDEIGNPPAGYYRLVTCHKTDTNPPQFVTEHKDFKIHIDTDEGNQSVIKAYMRKADYAKTKRIRTGVIEVKFAPGFDLKSLDVKDNRTAI